MKWKTLSSEYVYKDTWFTARVDRCEKPDGEIVEKYYVLEFPEWATALAITEEGKVLMVKQYRHALGEECIELPGGCIDAADATYEDGIRRELLEETGYAFEKVHYLGKTSPNPSTNNNLMHMFIATGGRKVQEQKLDEHEEIEVMEIGMDELKELLEGKRIIQAMHMTTIFYALRYLDKLNYGF